MIAMDSSSSDITLVEDCFGVWKTDDGCSEPVRRFTISNSKISVQVITYGAAITSIKVPDRNGKVDDVVLGFDNLRGYFNDYYFGCTVGRVANRINGGRFILQGREYTLSKNFGSHHLHGGFRGLDKVLWDSHVEGKTVTFSYRSPAWEEGYPGDLDCQVMYELDEDGKFNIHFRATTNTATPVNLVNHSYFNLAGHGSGPTYEHILSVEADSYTPVNKSGIPTGEIMPVENTVYDLQKPQNLGEILREKIIDGLDVNYCVNGEIGQERLAARLSHPKSGRNLEVYSTQAGIQVYSANFLPLTDALIGKNGEFYTKHAAICLEAQNYPDAVNNPNFPSCILNPGAVYEQKTTYNFFLDSELTNSQ